MAMPEQVFEPFGWENPMPTLPTTQLSLKEQKRTGHIFARCPMPLPEPDTKASNAPVECELCLDTLRVCRDESAKWHTLQQRDAQVWKVRGIALRADGNTVPFPGKVPTAEHIAALGSDYTASLSVQPEDYPEDEADDYLPPPPSIPSSLATEKQVALMVRLAAEKTPEWFNSTGLEGVTRRAQERTKAQASAAIDKLMAMPTVGNAKQMKRGAVPAGYYAIPTQEGAVNSLAFYRVDVPEEGKWAGYTFVKLIIGGQDPTRVPKAQAAGILARIAADPMAGPRYGQEIGKCCRCNRTLTNDESRAYGIGPECRLKGL